MSGTKAGKETNEFNQASNDIEQFSPAKHRLHAADGEHHVSHDSKGGQAMTRKCTCYSSRLRQARDHEERRGVHHGQRGEHQERRGA